jgi:hypothetical protein
MASSTLLTTPPSSPRVEKATPDRPRIGTPHPKASLSSPGRLTPKKLNLHSVSTDSTFSPLRTPATPDVNYREIPRGRASRNYNH